jgi:voltage-gated potassium channel Kch
MARAPAPSERPPTVADGQVFVFGTGAIGRAVCGLLQRAEVEYCAIESTMEDFLHAQVLGLRVQYGDYTDATMLKTLGVDNARLVIVAAGEFGAVQASLGSLRHFHSQVPTIATVPFLAQRDRLRGAADAEVVALMPEGAMRFGQAVLVRLGVTPDKAAEVVSQMAAGDYAALRGDPSSAIEGSRHT